MAVVARGGPGITRKLALLRVDAIALDGTMNLTVTAWNLPT